MPDNYDMSVLASAVMDDDLIGLPDAYDAAWTAHQVDAEVPVFHPCLGKSVQSLECLQFLCEHGYLESSSQSRAACLAGAAKYGTPDWFRYLAEEHGVATLTADLTLIAARCGNLPCLVYLRENGCPWDETSLINEAIENGERSIWQFMREQGCAFPASKMQLVVCLQRGDLECLQWAHESGVPWDASSCATAAAGGNLACLRYLHENGCPWDENTCYVAARDGNLHCLEYAQLHDCPSNLGARFAASNFTSGRDLYLAWRYEGDE